MAPTRNSFTTYRGNVAWTNPLLTGRFCPRFWAQTPHFPGQTWKRLSLGFKKQSKISEKLVSIPNKIVEINANPIPIPNNTGLNYANPIPIPNR